MIEYVWLTGKTYVYLMDDDSKHNKAKETKTFVITPRLLFKNYKYCLFNNKIISKLIISNII